MTPNETPTLRAFALLEQLVECGAPVSLAELARAADMPKGSLHRMLASLEAGGLVSREPGRERAYRVGPRLAALGIGVVLHADARHARHAILARLVAQIGETCNLAMLHEHEVLYIERVGADWPLRLELQAGSRVPAHCSASGKLLLAMLPPAQRSALVHALPLERHTPATFTDPELLEAELDRIAHKGIAVDNEEFVAGIVCVAAPVRDARGACVAALATQAPLARTPLARALGHVPRLEQAARELAQTF